MTKLSRPVYLLTEGSAKIGYGHVARCCAIYDAFKDRGFAPFLFIQGDDSVLQVLGDRQVEFLSWRENDADLEKKIQNAFCVVVDSYLAGLSSYEKIKNLVKCLVSIDDFDRLTYPKGIVVNGTILAETFRYRVTSGVQYLLGCQYAPLRKPFWEVLKRRSTLKTKLDVETVLITFGGDDRYNLTPRVLENLKKIKSGVKKKIIIARGYSNVEKIQLCVDSHTDLIFSPSGEEMMNHMCDSDLAISAAGTTLYELAACGVPTLMISVADNQKLNVEGWASVGFSKYVGCATDSDFDQKFISNYELAQAPAVREMMRSIGFEKVDGKGALRIVDSILKSESICERS